MLHFIIINWNTFDVVIKIKIIFNGFARGSYITVLLYLYELYYFIIYTSYILIYK